MSEEGGLTAYEAQRLEHIKRNHEMMVRLGLVSASPPAPAGPAKPRAPRARIVVAALPPESLRRSKRKCGAAPDYTREVIDTFGEELDAQAARGAKRARPQPAVDGVDSDGEDDSLARREILESTMAFLRESRAALLQFVTSEHGEAPADEAGWKAEAVRRWGELAGAAVPKGAQPRTWEVYVRSRLSTPPPPSPHDLLQEYYAADAWQLLCVCVLMSRVSSWETKHRCISAFFGAYPTPTAFAQSVVERGETAELRAMINSLGLFDDRLRSLAAITTAFLAGPDRFEPGMKAPDKIHGVGQFGVHSFLIFVRDQGAALKPDDAALTTFCNWRRKQAAADAATEAAPPASAEHKEDAAVPEAAGSKAEADLKVEKDKAAQCLKPRAPKGKAGADAGSANGRAADVEPGIRRSARRATVVETPSA